MGTFDAIDGNEVNTQSILSDIMGERIRLEEKQVSLKESVVFLSSFWSRTTPKFTEPELGDNDEIIKQSVPIEILYQFHPENQDEFIEHAGIVDASFAFVMDGIKEIYQELYDANQGNNNQIQDRMMPEMPQSLTMNVEREKTSVFGDLFKKYKEPDKDSPYYKMEKYLAFLKLIEDIWYHLREHQEKSVAGVGVNFTMASRREGMESRCGIYRQYFLAWVKPSIIKMMEYVIEKRIREITKYNMQILGFQAQVQQRHEKLM
ncbi:MAG: hypothetical protein HOD60_14975 [Candidatus Nitrosopelagicus sp.]|jgi:hypothetical protein|nr:hypothetical protein [Candidatus Nitrosopelagicus sp.]